GDDGEIVAELLPRRPLQLSRVDDDDHVQEVVSSAAVNTRRACNVYRRRTEGVLAVLRQLDGGVSSACVDRQAHVPPADRPLGFDEVLERDSAEIHAGVSAHSHENPWLALDHRGGRFPGVRCEHDVHVRLAPGLAGLQPHVECQARNAVDDVLGGAVLEIVDADAYPTMPASETAPRRRCHDLADEVMDMDTQI